MRTCSYVSRKLTESEDAMRETNRYAMQVQMQDGRRCCHVRKADGRRYRKQNVKCTTKPINARLFIVILPSGPSEQTLATFVVSSRGRTERVTYWRH